MLEEYTVTPKRDQVYTSHAHPSNHPSTHLYPTLTIAPVCGQLQEQAQNLSVGMIPRQILIILTDDVVDLCKAGDDAIITGTVIQRWSPLTKGVRCEIELAIVANNVLVSYCCGLGLD